MASRPGKESTPPKPKTPTNLFELPLVLEAGQAARVGAHLEVGRQFYNAVLSAGQRRLRRMRADPAQAERPAPSPARTSKSRGLDSIENKRSDTGLRFVLQTQDQGQPQGYLLWHDDHIPARIDWDDPVVAHSLAYEVKYARLVRRRTSSPGAQGADREGERYFARRPSPSQAQAHRRHGHHRSGPGTGKHRHRASACRGTRRAAVRGAASRCTSYPPNASQGDRKNRRGM